MSLRSRLAIATGGIAFVAVGTLAAGAYIIASHELRSQVDASLSARASTIVREISRSFDRPRFPGRQSSPLGPTLLQPEFDAITQVIGFNGIILASLGPSELVVHADELALAQSATDGLSLLYNTNVQGSSYRVLTVSLPSGGALQLGRDITDIEDARAGMRTWLIVFGFGGIVMAATAGWLIARRTTKPIEQLSATAVGIAASQDTSQLINIKASGEIADLVTSFNTMLQALGNSVAQQKQLVQDASHELRTPLTSLRANSELLERTDLPQHTREAIIHDIRAEIDELTALSSELSALASDQRSSEDPVEIDIAEVVQEVAERAQRRSGRIVELHSTAPAHVLVRPAQFDRALSNLIDNAIKFSPAGSKIDVFIKGTRIEVHDSGPGIAPEDRQFVFDRFYRAAATRAMPGSGLGLAIVKQFADIHQATTFVGASGTGGAMVGLDLAPTTTWGNGAHTVGTK